MKRWKENEAQPPTARAVVKRPVNNMEHKMKSAHFMHSHMCSVIFFLMKIFGVFLIAISLLTALSSIL